MEIKTFNEYQQAAETTAVYPGIGNNILYPTLGLTDEVGEFVKALLIDGPKDKVLMEAGDVFWYLAMLCNEQCLRLSHVMVHDPIYIDKVNRQYGIPAAPTIILQLFYRCAEISGIVKKAMRDHNGYVDDNGRNEIAMAIRDVGNRVIGLCAEQGIGIITILETNIEKLYDRQDRGVLHGSGDNR